MSITQKGILNDFIADKGGKYIVNTSATTPETGTKFFSIQALEDTVISAVTGNIDLSGATLVGGLTVFGEWTSITLTSGKVIAYQKGV